MPTNELSYRPALNYLASIAIFFLLGAVGLADWPQFGGPTGQGTWTSDGSDMCFDPEGDDENQQERCWTNGPVGEDGSFLSTRVDTGQAYVVQFLSE